MSKMSDALAQRNREKQSYVKVDFKEDFYNLREMKTQKIRILPPEDGELFPWIENHNHKLENKLYHTCKGAEGDADNCPVCRTLSKLWDDGDSIRQSIYREIKKKAIYTYNIVLLNDDGTAVDGKALLYDMPNSMHQIILDWIVESGEDPSDYIFNIVRKPAEKNRYYSDSHFDQTKTDFDDMVIEGVKPLNSGKYYKVSDKVISKMENINKQFNLGIDYSDFVSKPSKAQAVPLDLDDWEKKLNVEVED